MEKEIENNLLTTLQQRFEQNMQRHEGILWEAVLAKLKANPEKLECLRRMEETGGQPDVVLCQPQEGSIAFFDCSPESPEGRRSLCYDQPALQARKANKPAGSATGMAAEMGIQLLDENQYAQLQQLGEFDTKTSSWVATPANVRQLGGAIFCDRRFNRVFTYHNGADSYYSARGFRGFVQV